MKTATKAKPASKRDERDKPRPPLARTPEERVFMEFEQALICASEAFYRFAGVLLGPTGAQYKLTGHENVIFQQLLFTPNSRSVSDLSRFSNRDDISNIHYSLRKLTAAGLVEKVPGSTNRDTRYRPTAAGHKLTEDVIESRRELLIEPSSGISELETQLDNATQALSLLTGLYDNATRKLTGRT